MSINIIIEKNHILLLSENAQALNVSNLWFDAQELKQRELIKKKMMGRGSVYFFQAPESFTQQEQANILYALRHYRRGGAIAKLSKDRFMFTGIRNTRCYKELGMLEYLHKNAVNVPVAIAARVIKQLPFYQADIVTEVIPDAIELHEILRKSPLKHSLWESIGKEIRKMHSLGVCHYDINVKNVLIQDEKVYLIDFDKCDKKAGDTWKASNVARFKRSITKQSQKHSTYYFSESDWRIFDAAYRG